MLSKNMAIGLRSFAAQAAKNYRSMLGMGYAFTERPLLDSSEASSGERRKASIAFFNTMPYFIPLTVGITTRARAEGWNESQVADIKQAVMGPFGALGDRLYWARLKPVAALCGIAVALWGNPLLGIITLFVVYNLLHLPLRLLGFGMGYNSFTHTPAVLEKLKPYRIMAGLELLGGLAIGFILASVLSPVVKGYLGIAPICVFWGILVSSMLVGTHFPFWLKWFVVGLGGSIIYLLLPTVF